MKPLTQRQCNRLVEAAKRGEALLNHFFGEEWVKRVKLDKFVFSNPNACVLGQTFRGTLKENGFREGLELIPRLAELSGEKVKLRKNEDFANPVLNDSYYGFNGGLGMSSSRDLSFLEEWWMARLKVLQRRVK